MIHDDSVRNDYFEWIYELMCEERYANDISYRRLFKRLHDTEFLYLMPIDKNRAGDGEALRWRFALVQGLDYIPDSLNGSCSILEMMVGLALRCEETIMDDTRYGNRTGQWFWDMIVSLGLGSMYDSNFDERYVDKAILRFLYREYEPDGKGGLFTIKNCDLDLRELEIWDQLNLYIEAFV